METPTNERKLSMLKDGGAVIPLTALLPFSYRRFLPL